MCFLCPVILASAALLAGCAPQMVQEPNDALAEAEAYYQAHPEFFIFAAPKDLPKDLRWQRAEGVAPWADSRAVVGGTLRDFIADFPRTLRVVGPDSNGSFRSVILDSNALSLLSLHPNDPEVALPSLAKEWAVSDDKTTVYFRLDPDARFSDGEEITSADYFFAFFFFRSPHIHDPWYNNFYATEYKAITRYDDFTIAITLPRARPDFLEKAGGLRPMPRQFYAELGDDYPSRYQWKFEPTTGPYEVRPADLRKGRSVTLRRVKNWWANEKPFLAHRFNPENLIFTVVRDPNKAFELFLAGEIDMFFLNLPEYWYDRAPKAPAVKGGYIQRATFYNDLPRPTWGLYLNVGDALLKDVHVRRGLAAALNWERVLSFFFRGDYERLPGYAQGYGKFTNSHIQPQNFNLELAAKEFALAGFAQRGNDGILRSADGSRLSITLTASEGPLSGALMILKEEALKAGVELNLEILDPTTAFKKTSEKKHQAAFMGFAVSAERFPRYWEMFHGVNAKPQTNNLCNLDDAEINALIERYDTSTDEEEIRKISWELQERLDAQSCFIPAFMRTNYRMGFWRWVRFPEGFDVKTGLGASDLLWLDEAAQEETFRARNEGRTFENTPLIFDQWKNSSK